jgi:N,N'-diacetyllegionaminate synthase
VIVGTHDTAQRPLLIAEIGNNHEGDPAFALELAEAAVEAGADAVKVQIIDPSRLVNVSQGDRVAQLTRFRLDHDVFMEMARRVRNRGRLFVASVFDCATLVELQHELDAIKIASGDLDFDPLLEIAAASNRPIILSTGMSTMDEIVRAVSVIGRGTVAPLAIADRLAVLHCVSLYPTPLAHANLAAIPRIAEEVHVTVGYSDHTLGIEAALVALSFGARIIEKHFTLDKNRSTFRDHALSAEPQELARLAAVMRGFDEMVGSGVRGAPMADAATRAVARRSTVAARLLPAGTELQPSDLDYVRPAGGLPPSEARQLFGRRLRRSVAYHGLINLADVE